VRRHCRTPTRAARLYSHRRGKSAATTFTYDNAYLGNGDAYQLDPALPMMSGMLQTPTNRPIFAAFADSCPEHGGRHLIQRTEK
jgi:hypothetical protein